MILHAEAAAEQRVRSLRLGAGHGEIFAAQRRREPADEHAVMAAALDQNAPKLRRAAEQIDPVTVSAVVQPGAAQDPHVLEVEGRARLRYDDARKIPVE